MKAIGIDLGTTNSVAAYCEPDQRNPRVLSNSSGENLTPSAVVVRRSKRDGKPADILVGREALSYAEKAPEDTILSIKRLMGRDYADPQVSEVARLFSHTIVPGPDEDPRAHVRLDGRIYTPAQVSAMILRKIKEDASRALGEEVTHAVITVPAYFKENQRAATLEAGELAGLIVKKIIDEPTAAAIAFGVQRPPEEKHRILVYDLGGGTFDISILQMVKDKAGKDQFEVLGMDGDTWLGGDDFDHRIIDRMIEHVKRETREDPSGDKRFLFTVKDRAEQIKRALSQVTELEALVPGAYKSRGVLVDVDFTLGRDEFESMIEGHVARSMELVQKALGRQSLTRDDISDVLLVGGATLTPLVYQNVESFFGLAKVRRSINPMECVALGASILAAALHSVQCSRCQEVNDETAKVCAKCGHNLSTARAVGGGISVTETTPFSLGIAAVKGSQRDAFVPIIPKGTVYPLREPMKQLFQAGSRKLIKVPVYEGDDPVASQNEELGVLEYKLPHEIDLDTRVEVSFNYDRNRILTVTIRVSGTDLFMTETLRRDRPRQKRPKERIEAKVEEIWQDELEETVGFARKFLNDYQIYMEPSQSMKLQRDIDRAEQLLAYPNEVEGRRMIRILQRDVFNCGLATELFLADRALNGANLEEASKIGEAARIVRQSHERGERDRAADQAKKLKALVAQTLERRIGIQEIADQEDYGGLLRQLIG